MNKVVQNVLISVIFFNKAGAFQTGAYLSWRKPSHHGLRVYNRSGGLGCDMIIKVTHIVKMAWALKVGWSGFKSLLPFILPEPL